MRPESVREPFTATILNLSDEDRKANAGGKFTQYTLTLLRIDGSKTQIRFLFESDLAPLSRKYGEDPADWINKQVVVDVKAENDSKGIERLRWVLRP